MSVQLSAVFAFRDKVLTAIRRLKQAHIPIRTVRMPVPDHELLDAIDHKPSKVGFVTLFGGITGLLVGFFGPAVAHFHWGLTHGGKPLFSVPPFVVIAFELTILFGASATLIGLLLLGRMVLKKPEEPYDPRVSEDHYMIVLDAPEEQADEARRILGEEGGEVAP